LINIWIQVHNKIYTDYYRVIEGKVEVAKAVTRLTVDSICFTGSTATGRLVAM
jgi:acyl-CoA reductase-like NAD-dependent aldehyde dehydrogenase